MCVPGGGLRAAAVGLSMVVAFAIAYALLHPLVGAGATILAFVPPTLGASFLGLRWGIALSLLTFAAAAGLWTAFGDEPGTPVVRVGSGIGAALMVVLAAGIGHLRDLNRTLAARLREHERLAARLEASELELRAASGELAVVYLAFDPGGRIWRSEGAGLERLGLRSGSLDGRDLLDLCGSEPDRAAVRLVLDGRAATGHATLAGRPVLFSWLPTRDEAGTFSGGVGVAVPAGKD